LVPSRTDWASAPHLAGNLQARPLGGLPALAGGVVAAARFGCWPSPGGREVGHGEVDGADGRGGGELLDQVGLAYPRLPAQQDHQRLAVAGTGQQLAQPRQLVGAADEAARGDLVGHVGPSMTRRC
jgi:hypothetical protein